MREVMPDIADLQDALEERDEIEARRCPHGELPGERCEDCAEESRPRPWWRLPCGADV